MLGIDWLRAEPKRWIVALALAWLAGAGIAAFATIPEDEILTINSPSVQQRLRDECGGTFQQRYDCKESIITEIGRQTFLNLAIRSGIVALGPLAALIVFVIFFRKKRGFPAALSPKLTAGDGDLSESDSSLAWKREAQSNIVHYLHPSGDDLSSKPDGPDSAKNL
jgi:hypothetical protein